jgi:hypothetical protein
MKQRRLEIPKHGASMRVNGEGVIDFASTQAYQWAVGAMAAHVTEWLRARGIRYSMCGWRPRRGEA